MATIIQQRYIELHTCHGPESAKLCSECRRQPIVQYLASQKRLPVKVEQKVYARG